MTTYIEQMKSATYDSFSLLFEGVAELVLTDFPDHPNVGDSAIALVEIEYFNCAMTRILDIRSIGTLPSRTYSSSHAIVIHGGGNIGGLYPHHELHRMLLARDLQAATKLIQAPQSISFVNDAAKSSFFRTVGSRENFRIGVRDVASQEQINGISGEIHLVPDAIHMLGSIVSKKPTNKTVILARTDDETARHDPLAGHSVDWPRESQPFKTFTRFRKHAAKLPGGTSLFNPTNTGWQKIAQKRFDRGVNTLSSGETIITDRLHAMLIGLQMGRNVIAVDNLNFKLSRYAETWFGTSQPPLRFAKDFDSAKRIGIKSKVHKKRIA